MLGNGSEIGTSVVGVRLCEVMEIIEEDGHALGLNGVSERLSHLGGFVGSNGEEDGEVDDGIEDVIGEHCRSEGDGSDEGEGSEGGPGSVEGTPITKEMVDLAFRGPLHAWIDPHLVQPELWNEQNSPVIASNVEAEEAGDEGHGAGTGKASAKGPGGSVKVGHGVGVAVESVLGIMERKIERASHRNDGLHRLSTWILFKLNINFKSTTPRKGLQVTTFNSQNENHSSKQRKKTQSLPGFTKGITATIALWQFFSSKGQIRKMPRSNE
ncbi:hypothetical protein E2542_SST23272 [Spatholobus suberectus]|nr:hypothetical protein E2542_SST23272 [Spatholobus suberectus]